MQIANRKHHCRIGNHTVNDDHIRNDICSIHAKQLDNKYPKTTRRAREQIFNKSMEVIR